MIRLSDRDAVEAAIEKIMGRARSFMPTYEDLVSAVERAEQQMQTAGVPRSKRNGALVIWKPRGPSKSYRYSSKSVSCSLSRRGGKWYLSGLELVRIYPAEKEGFFLQPPKAVLTV